MKTRARETDERSSKRMHTSPAHVLPSCYLFSLQLYFIYGQFQTHVIFILFSFLLSLYSFSHEFGTVSVKVFFFQFLASLFHVILVYPSVWATIKHFRQIEQNQGARLMSPLTVTVKPLSLQTSERHFSFLFFLVVKECV